MTNFSRRRFLKITVATSAVALSPYGAGVWADEPTIWNGFVLGADASIKVHGNKKKAQAAINASLKVIETLEAQLSIYDPQSTLSILNARGVLKSNQTESRPIYDLIKVSKRIHQNTGGLFDPTIQPLFSAYAKARGYPYQKALETVQALVGIEKVDVSKALQISFRKQGMALTFNGIAQGYITDQVRQELNSYGYERALVNIGEYSAGDEDARIGIADTSGEIFDVATLRNQAIATSSPTGYRFPDGTSHIFHPDGKRHIAHWDTISVVAKDATLADGYSTALALTSDSKLAKNLVKDQILQKVILKDMFGNVYHVG